MYNDGQQVVNDLPAAFGIEVEAKGNEPQEAGSKLVLGGKASVYGLSPRTEILKQKPKA